MWASLTDLPTWATVALAGLSIVTAGGGTKAIVDLVRWLIARRDAQLEGTKGMARVFRSVSRINAALRELREDTGAATALLFRASNGGKIPQPGSRLFSSAIFEDHAACISGLMETWQAQELDASYVSMLVEIDRRGFAVYRTDSLPESTLRSAYEANGIVEACVFETNGGRESAMDYYYGSITWSEADEIPTPAVLADEVRIARSVIGRELAKTLKE
jgi:hypothetical protein